MEIEPKLYNWISKGVGTGVLEMDVLRRLHAYPTPQQIREQIAQEIEKECNGWCDSEGCGCEKAAAIARGEG